MNNTGIRQRLAAILAADAAGYSRLMATDERATVAALDAARKEFRLRVDAPATLSRCSSHLCYRTID